jgi:CheY-like chemotaxis protein
MSLPEFFFERVTADIRQQMAGILALADQLARQPLTADAKACVDGVTDSALGVKRLLESALDLSVFNKGVALQCEPVVLRELMDQIQEQWRLAAQQSGVTVFISYDGPPEAAVLGDRQRLLQVFSGYIGKAVASTPRGAIEAGLRAVDCEEGVRLQVRVRGARDPAWSGRDIEARVKDVDARFGLEVALNLVMARSLLDAMDGRFGVGAGDESADTTVFELVLPAAPEEDADAHHSPGRSAHVLVVDDNATNRMVAQALCEMFDCTCEAAGDGLEAVDAARAGRFDLILMDIKMPRMDGVTAARAIRELPGLAGAVPIVALTANADPDDAAGYLAAGMDGVVEKPMKPEHLLAVLQQALSVQETAAA